MNHNSRALSSLLLLSASILSGCSSSITMNVKAYRDPALNLTKYKTFNIISLNQDQSLLNKEILYLTEQKLVKRGLVYKEDNPDLFIFLNHYIGPYEYYVPPSISYIPVHKPGEKKTYSGYVGGMFYYGTEKTKDSFELQAVRTEGYTEIAYYRNISLLMADVEEYLKTGEVKLIWEGTVDSGGSNSDLLTVAPYLLNELLDEFPSRTGKPTKRTVYMTQTRNKTTQQSGKTETQMPSQTEFEEDQQKTNLPNFRAVVKNTGRLSDQQILKFFREKYPRLKSKNDIQLIQLIEASYGKKLKSTIKSKQ